MITVQNDGTLIVDTDAGIAVFFYGQGEHKTLVALSNVGLADNVAGKVRRKRNGDYTEISSGKPIALWVSPGIGFGLSLIGEMDQRSYRKLCAQLAQGMPDEDARALLEQMKGISRWLPSFAPIINGA